MRLALVLLALVSAPIAAQATVRGTTEMRSEPRGALIATLRPGTAVRTEGARGRYTRVLVEGWVSARVVARGRSSASVRVPTGDRVLLRASASTGARSAATFVGGTTLSAVSRRAGWVKVRRGGWVPTSALVVSRAPSRTRSAGLPRAPEREADTATRRASGGDVAPASAAPPLASPVAIIDTALAPARSTMLRLAPDGRSVGTVAPGVTLMPLARERGWMRVRVEGWVKETDVLPLDTALRTGLSAADLRADPAGSKGRIVRWSVQVLAIQTADPLRKDLAPDETYLLARGPDEENALLYLAVPPSLLESAKAIPALTPVIITARVRVGRSEPVGVPILDLRSITRR